MTTAAQVIAVARSQIGVTESPTGSNHTKYGIWYGLDKQPWCAIFVSWVFNQAGHPLPNIDTPKGFHYTPTGVNWAKAHGVWSEDGHYAPGDIVFYNFDADAGPEHTGIIVADDGHTLMAIEGNTSVAGSQSNGGQVCVKQRAHGHEVMGVLQMSMLLATQPPAAKPPVVKPAVPPVAKVPMIAVDFSGSAPSVAALKAANVGAVLRYVGKSGGKYLSGEEARACLAAGIDVLGINETIAQRCLQGYDAGHGDALIGLADLTAKCGRPARCIGLAVDFDANNAQLVGPISDYFRGACAAVGKSKVLVYGGYYAVKVILDAGLATFAWQAYGWSPKNPAEKRAALQERYVDPRAGLFQRLGFIHVGGTECDSNVILRPDFGQVYAKPPEEFTLSEAAAILAAVASLKADVAHVKADVAGARAEEAARYVVYTNRDHANAGVAKTLAGAVDAVPAGVWADQPLPAVAAAVAELAADHAKLRADVTRLLKLASAGDVDDAPAEPPVTT
jgi:hypothetical protein